MLKSPLHNLHIELGAKIGQFAGYEMPLWYPSKIIAEHHHTRKSASLFDISHMGQVSVSGSDSIAELEALMPTDLFGLPTNRMRYTCFTNGQGGILDDLIVSNLDSEIFIVINAARKEHDVKHLRDNLSDSSIVEHSDHALIALQGPTAADVLRRWNSKICDLAFMSISKFDMKGVPCIVSRSGYTGEDGFEISIPADSVVDFAWELLNEPEVMPAGLGARDSLRLEAGLRLYGQDMDAETTPVEAGIQWTIPKSRRTNGEREGGFPGSDVILEQLNHGVSRKIAGMVLKGNAPARTGVEVALDGGKTIGIVTSGTFAPTVGSPITMGYVDSAHAAPGSQVNLMLRGKPKPATIVKLPFVQHQYHK